MAFKDETFFFFNQALKKYIQISANISLSAFKYKELSVSDNFNIGASLDLLL